MSIFQKKKSKYVDIGRKLERTQEKIDSFKEIQKNETNPTEEQNSPSFFGNFFSNNQETQRSETSNEEKKEKLKRKLIEMTNKLEEQEKEIYNLKQRMEILERKQRLSY